MAGDSLMHRENSFRTVYFVPGVVANKLLVLGQIWEQIAYLENHVRNPIDNP